jgi:hypothetical protein
MRFHDGFARRYQLEAHQEPKDYTNDKECHDGIEIQKGYPFMVDGKYPRPDAFCNLVKRQIRIGCVC